MDEINKDVMSFFCFRILPRISHFYVILCHVLLAMIISETFFVFEDLDGLEKYWSGILQNVTVVGLTNFFS